MDMATLNTHVPGWASNTNSSLGWFGDNTKPAYRRYDLEGMAGYYYFQLNISDDGGFTAYNCSGYITLATVNCCQDSPGVGANCACNCTNNCGTTYHGQCTNCGDCAPPPGTVACWSYDCQCSWLPSMSGNSWRSSGVNCVGPSGYAPAVCSQCSIIGNCDSRAWMQPNCNCMQCNCGANCGQCGGQCAQCVNCNGNCSMECTNCYACNCACQDCG